MGEGRVPGSCAGCAFGVPAFLFATVAWRWHAGRDAVRPGLVRRWPAGWAGVCVVGPGGNLEVWTGRGSLSRDVARAAWGEAR